MPLNLILSLDMRALQHNNARLFTYFAIANIYLATYVLGSSP